MDHERVDACIAEKVLSLLEEDEVVFEKLVLILTYWTSIVK
jgi:hypothetical protein